MTEPELLDRLRLVGRGVPARRADRSPRPLLGTRGRDRRALLRRRAARPARGHLRRARRRARPRSRPSSPRCSRGSGVLVARATCDSSDDFSSVWRKALSEIAVQPDRRTRSASGRPRARRAQPAAGLLGSGAVTPHAVQRALGVDRPADAARRHLRRVRSARRSCRQGPRALRGHDQDALRPGRAGDDRARRRRRRRERADPRAPLGRAGARADPDAAHVARRAGRDRHPRRRVGADDDREDLASSRITVLSQGLPHYTHLLDPARGAGRARRAPRRTSRAATSTRRSRARSTARSRASPRPTTARRPATGTSAAACCSRARSPRRTTSASSPPTISASRSGKLGAESGESLEQDLRRARPRRRPSCSGGRRRAPTATASSTRCSSRTCVMRGLSDGPASRPATSASAAGGAGDARQSGARARRRA